MSLFYHSYKLVVVVVVVDLLVNDCIQNSYWYYQICSIYIKRVTQLIVAAHVIYKMLVNHSRLVNN